jgi:hypothetical protein
MEKLTNSDLYTIKAAEHFGIDENDVTPKQRMFIKEQEYSGSYGGRGIPLRSYSVTEEGTVEFDDRSSKELVESAAWLPPYGDLD